MKNRRRALLERLSKYHTVPGHGPIISEMSDDELESYLNILDRTFEAAYKKVKEDVEDEDY